MAVANTHGGGPAAGYKLAGTAGVVSMVLVAAGGLFADKSNVVTSLSLVGFLLFVVWALIVSLFRFRS